MKSLISIIFLAIITSSMAQVSINTDNSAPEPSAGLDVKFSDKGFLMPRMTFDQRNAIPAPAEGLMVFCTNCGTNGAMSLFANGAWRTFSPCATSAPTATANAVSPGQIIWHWNLPPGASGARWNTTNNFDAAEDMGTVSSKTETGISCGSTNSRYIWAYNDCGNSSPVTLLQSISGAPPAIPTPGTHTSTPNSITWHWNTVPDAIGYKWNTSNDYATATDMGTDTTKTETGLACSVLYPRFVWAYNGCGHSSANVMTQSTLACLICGVPFTIVHLTSEGVAPVNKSVTYGTAMDIPGETSKCWITNNLGASHQATAVDDATEESAGWYWQFNRKQGYKHDGTTSAPSWPGNSISENSDWVALNDPCKIELGNTWRIPTVTEWSNVKNSGGWTTWSIPFNSNLRLHASGKVLMDGSLMARGIVGYFYSSSQGEINQGTGLQINDGTVILNSNAKGTGLTLRCLSPIEGLPTILTTAVSSITQTTATGGGNVTDDGGHAVTERGICWSTTPNPTTANSKTINGSGTGSFTSNMTGLTANTLYYVRAYATNSVATVYGDQVSFTTLIPFAIGQSYAGGIIFYIDGTGQHGLISSISDQGIAPWGCQGISIPGTSVAVGTGQANTTAIVNGCSTAGIAARICNDLVLQGYDDWFLPSRGELTLMCQQKTAIGGFTSVGYWSSSDFNTGYAWWWFFADCSQGYDNKTAGYHIRAIRAF